MAMHKALIEMIRVSGGTFLLLCIASAIGVVLLMLTLVSFISAWAKCSQTLKTEQP